MAGSNNNPGRKGNSGRNISASGRPSAGRAMSAKPRKQPVGSKPSGSPSKSAVNRVQTVNSPARSPKKSNNVNLKSQGSNARRREIRRRKLSPEEIEDMRRREKIRLFQLRQKRKNRLRALLFRILITAAAYLIMLAVTCGTFAFSIYSGMNPEYPGYTYTIGSKDADDTVVTTYDGSFIFRSGMLYVNLSDIASYFGWVTTGDYESVRYIIPSSDGTDYQELLFDIGSDGVTVNGTRIRMEGNSFEYERELFVPISFLEKNVNGILITKNEKKHRIQIEHSQVADSDGKLQNEDITLSIKKDVPSEHIDYLSVATYIQAKQAAEEAAAAAAEPKAETDSAGTGTPQ